MRPGYAVAVSYAIGDFGRAKHTIGHSADDYERPIILEFGKEWDIPGMIDLFAKISAEKSAIWIDQLSILQDNEAEITRQLQRIPEIFSTLEVVVLIPNEPLCLSQRKPCPV